MTQFRLTLLLAVVFIFPALAQEAVEEPAAPKELKNPKVSRVNADLQTIASALQTYHSFSSQFPTQAQGLQALVEKPTKGPLPKRWIRVMNKVPIDPWGNPYVLATRKSEKEKDDGKEEHYLFSNGPDAKDSKDDIELVLRAPEPSR